MKRVIITFLCLLCIVQAYSQSFTISGTIIDGESNEPLIGAGILVKGAGRGTITNIDGKYSLEVKRGETLVFSFVGYQNQEVAITNQRTLNIALRVSEANNLNEVVITGRGSAKRITLTGAVSGIQANELRRVPTSSLQNTLSGKLPGFFSQQRSGQPGKAMEGAPHEVILVLDGTNGQNALMQAKAFDESAGLTGLIITKLDGTAKGGVLVALANSREKPLPIYYIGVGETIDDLQPFKADEFAAALIGLDQIGGANK